MMCVCVAMLFSGTFGGVNNLERLVLTHIGDGKSNPLFTTSTYRPDKWHSQPYQVKQVGAESYQNENKAKLC